ncbi:MAG: hypothetical protein K6A96_14140 [Prevotella sp.]|nr:hypothetical protein [Prevotella sp.]
MKNILLSAITVIGYCLTVTGLTSCSDDNDPAYLDEVRVSSSFVAIPQDGGSTTITVTAADEWAFANQQWIQGKDTLHAAAPRWLTISQDKGSAGETKITFSAEGALDGRNCDLLLNCGGRTQHIKVIQGLATVADATCAEVIAGPDSKNYRVTGVCTRIANTNYGNWYLQDETGEIYIYGTVDASGKYNWASFGIDVGDVVTVEGPKTTYNGTVELVDVSVISVRKSLIKIEEQTQDAFNANGGDFIVRVSEAGNGVYVSIPASAKDWLGFTSMVKTDSTTNISFHVAPNTGEASRSAVITFTSSNSTASSTVTASVSQMGLMGTLTNPFTVEQAIEYCQTLSGNSANDYYIKGTVSRIANNGTFGSYGNATFFISDDGEFLGEDDKNPDKAHDFEAYRVLYFGNEKWNADVNKGNISVGDEVVICGKLTLYNGISETASGNAYVYSINGTSTDVNGLGSAAYPFNIAGAIAAIDGGVTANVFVKGIISEIANNGLFGAQYGNGTFWISDDGVRHNDPALDFEAYRVLWLGNRKWQEGDDQIAVGDEVILHGQLTKYGTTYETSSGKAYIFSLNGKTE